mgnify:CR=1 FL=1
MFFRQFLLFIIFFQFSNAIFAQDDIESDILFQKIQELEIEIANLRNELESLNYLIQKLIDESSREVGNDESNDIENIADSNGIRFKGLDDKKSKEEIYRIAINNLENQNLQEAYISFKFFAENLGYDLWWAENPDNIAVGLGLALSSSTGSVVMSVNDEKVLLEAELFCLLSILS